MTENLVAEIEWKTVATALYLELSTTACPGRAAELAVLMYENALAAEGPDEEFALTDGRES